MNKRATTVAAFNTSIDELANIENNLDRIVTDYMNPDASEEDRTKWEQEREEQAQPSQNRLLQRLQGS